MCVCKYNSPIGDLFITVKHGCLVELTTAERQLSFNKKSAYKPVIEQITDYLDKYFKGENPVRKFPIELNGTAFQKNVWKVLLEIPYGTPVTYKQIAEKVFDKNPCAQAVGGAVGKNPILIIVPCHRVLGSKNSLTGFSAGIDIKKQLLQLENISYKE